MLVCVRVFVCVALTSAVLWLCVRTGVFIGASATTTAHTMLANRISYTLGLHGPSVTIDTACSSSLVAIHDAVQSLRRGDCVAAVAGGVHLPTSRTATAALAAAHMLSPTGCCHTFDAAADGYVRGEGVGCVVLTTADRAAANGVTVLATVCGVAVNHNGKSSGITAPSGYAQKLLLQAALQDAALHPREVAFIESHGTGTKLGDPVEINAICDMFRPQQSTPNPENADTRALEQPRVLIGAVKTNIGHLEAAAGVAGFIKAVLALTHRTMPANLHLRTPNPNFASDAHRVVQLVTETTAIAARENSLYGGVSSFGYGGTNAHCVLRAARTQPQRKQVRSGSMQQHPMRVVRAVLFIPCTAIGASPACGTIPAWSFCVCIVP